MQMAYVQSQRNHIYARMVKVIDLSALQRKCIITRFDCQDIHRDAPVPTSGCCTSLGLSKQGPEPVFGWRQVIRQQSIISLANDHR